VNRKLAAVSAFYAHQARNGAEVADLLAAWKAGGRGGWKPFLHHISKGKPYRGRAISLKAPAKLPRILTVAETQAILDACTRLRDRFFFALMHESGCRAGEALGLRHEDIAAAEQEITIVVRDNANRARAKSGGRAVPVGPELIRLYADYLHGEYGDICSDYVFINIWAQPRGRPGPTRRPMTLCCGCGPGPASISTRTGSGTRRRPGGSATASPSRSSPGCLATHR
jgi:integrase